MCSPIFVIMRFLQRYLPSVWCLLILELGEQTITTVKGDKFCDPTTVAFGKCQSNETCVTTDARSGTCQCRAEFLRSASGVCQPVPLDPTSSPDLPESGVFNVELVLWVLIPTLFAGAVGTIVYTGRHKAWLHRLYLMRIRMYNNELVTSQDEDDPPIA